MHGQRNESGATAVEYALLVAALLAMAVVILGLKGVLGAVFLDNATNTGCVTKTDGTRVGELCNDEEPTP